MKLLISQKDELFDLIESSGLSPSQFEFSEVGSSVNQGDLVTSLNHNNSDFFFKFESGQQSQTSHYSIFCPGGSSYTENQYPGGWDGQLHYVGEWLYNLMREINTPNKWDRLKKEIEGITINYDSDEGKFTITEYEDLEQKILSLQKGIKSIGLSSEQVSAIDNKLEHLTDLAKGMNKFDWKSLFVGTVISIVIQLSISPENVNALWILIEQTFNNLLLP